jgi:siroheme synthase-like protein
VLVDLDGAHCLVVGGGPVAERRVHGLLDAGARVTVVAPHLTAGLQARGEGGHLRILAEPFGAALLAPERGRTWRLVVAATADRSVNAEVVRLASGLGLWVNDASDPTGGPRSRCRPWPGPGR